MGHHAPGSVTAASGARAWLMRPARSSCLLRTVSGVVATAFLIANATAQEAEPRSYSNAPVGLNFLIAGYVYAQGKIAFDPSLPIADAQFHSHTGALAYVRSLDIAGQSAKFDVILP